MNDIKQIINEKKVLELKSNFRIPLYQRPYAWGEDEVIQLLEDLKLFHRNNKDNNYFLGNIVVSKKDEVFDVIDGQQRLTTLYLILKILKKENNKINIFNLDYEIREKDRKFLKNWNGSDNLPDNINIKFIENIKAIFKWKKDNEEEFENILKNVVVTITEIPEEVDVVKYFEVMNNRGKQLEKHEILKAKFLDVLKEEDKSRDWAKIWDYCSVMDSSIEDLIYYNDFKQKERSEEGFSKLRENLIKNFFHEKLNTKLKEENELKILDILNENKIDEKEEQKFHSKHSYRSVVKFPIFLIQILKMFKVKFNNNKIKPLDEIIVNDRYLLDYFHEDDNHIKFIFNKGEAKEFLNFMLKIRILFDYFIFKRDLDQQEKAVFLPLMGENNDLLMIELLFNVSAPQYFSQDWIVIFLAKLDKMFKNGVDNKNKINNIIESLEEFDKELAQIRLKEEKILDFINKKLQNIYQQEVSYKVNFNKNDLEKLDDILNQGTSTPHYWFYKLDYLLWKDWKNNK